MITKSKINVKIILLEYKCLFFLLKSSVKKIITFMNNYVELSRQRINTLQITTTILKERFNQFERLTSSQ